MTEPRKINALVEGREDYRVTIDLDGFTNCHCNCPVSGHCKHMAAVLLNYAEQQNRSVQVLANAKAASFCLKYQVQQQVLLLEPMQLVSSK